MKAIVQDKYGPPDDVPQLKEIDRPVITDDEVLVRVRAATARVVLGHSSRPAVHRTCSRQTARTKQPYSGIGDGRAS
jgi:hypothetical protein